MDIGGKSVETFVNRFIHMSQTIAKITSLGWSMRLTCQTSLSMTSEEIA